MSGEAKSEWLPLRSPKFYANQGIEVLTNTRVAAVDPRAKTVATGGGERLKFDKVLLATGAVPRTPTVPGGDGEACFSLRSFADARSIAEAAGGAAGARSRRGRGGA
jgi:NAD(P)H-nitrite reductase large subunit